ncbi:hypothetical protein NTD84_13725 [Pseudomonas sp. 14P_8.1_Bac3]|uniref:hypothetical protein n=1 Tax=Pseudomonas sp. 14P_8.1_Bac3 TaxID=2971621 RepID=UPI0021C82B90|nr:hypothetical protein [Pseudomonas sp. 14P_8.1_Bac3]MCU1760772.1 hypothetical protein [Pseudomonas sp. 14P_8.1_Bac3]
MSTGQLVTVYLGGWVFFSIFVCLGVFLHIACTKMKMLVELFPNSIGVKTMAPLKNGGVWGKLILVGGISGYLAFPRPYLKNGQLCSKDLEAIPKPLRHKLAFVHWVLVIHLIAMFALYFLGKFGKLY